MSETLRVTAGFTTLVISFFGLLVNAYVFRCFTLSNKFQTDFYMFCTSRTISNFIICLVFFVWSSPCTIIGFFYLPQVFNIAFGQLSGYLAYVSGLLIQLVISINRFYVSFSPINGERFRKKYGLYAGICFAWSCAIICTVFGLRTDCGFVYDIDKLSWKPEEKPCAQRITNTMFHFVFIVAAAANTLNFFTFVRLLYDTKKRLVSLSSSQNLIRRKKRIQMFAQSCTQDLLYVIDMTFGVFISSYNDAPWFTFLTTSLSWLLCHVIDGTVMVVFNKDIHPKIRVGHSRTVSTIAT